ncbi:alpha/beta hydrolase [Paraburkholderia sp. Ac-20336]|uniref:alpha/beta fold hydrolase n=1 Tax=Burkholderiaceae TaxID=119060 RepID=UPI00141F71B9|nr:MULTISPECIES: alpha/beta fold hydrolase [Burkholderiaceae]MBN3804395.1 alpha/beta hydrolase [Paraburkholderia sp. Ac-20336]MBN3847192.1 alpha/beta hydrolase [Paraburkholderia sp. Ac-20342]NIF50617.1 alpha/beta hydrolase [Burkholderia sp. Ax-1724]NIF79511.1 alpha/beta hydrolase [Paraburkholderia sp. Cy-641]
MKNQYTRTPSKLLFLPGASGNTAFWQPLANRLTNPARKVIVAYPGFGQEPAAPDVNDIDDLLRMVVDQIDQPTALIAQSMGGVIAIRAALAKPDLVTHLVLTVTSGGIDTQALGATDWRSGLSNANPPFPDWFTSFKADLTHELRRIAQPVLLLWGDADPISPVAVGRRLLELLPDARLHVVAGGNHDLAHEYAPQLAPLVDAHLSQT